MNICLIRTPHVGEYGLTDIVARVSLVRVCGGRKPDVYGERRIGGISPTVMETVPYDFYRIAPEDVGLVGITCNIDFWDRENFDQALATVTDSASYLADRNVDFIIHFGTPLVVTRGPGFDQELIEMIESRTGVRATTSIRSAIDAMRHMNAQRIAVASPYPENINQGVEAFLQGNGFDVVKLATMDVNFKALQDVDPATIYSFACGVLADAPEADALHMPCPQWPAANVVDAVERDCGKPVIQSDCADFWAAFSAIGVRDRIGGYGRLLASLAAD